MADGSFQINHWKKKYLQYTIIIKLKNHSKNILMLQNLRTQYNIGTINIRSNFVIWAINNKKDIKKFLDLIHNNPLLNLKLKTKIKILKMIYCLNNNMSYNEYQYLNEKEKLNEWIWPFPKPNYLDKKPIFDNDSKYWLTGFIEAEGCFSVRSNGNQSFSIGQKEDKIILESIKEWFLLPNKIQVKKGNFYVIETYSLQKCLLIIDFIDNYKLHGEKVLSFDIFKKHVLKKVVVSSSEKVME